MPALMPDTDLMAGITLDRRQSIPADGFHGHPGEPALRQVPSQSLLSCSFCPDSITRSSGRPVKSPSHQCRCPYHRPDRSPKFAGRITNVTRPASRQSGGLLHLAFAKSHPFPLALLWIVFFPESAFMAIPATFAGRGDSGRQESPNVYRMGVQSGVSEPAALNSES